MKLFFIKLGLIGKVFFMEIKIIINLNLMKKFFVYLNRFFNVVVNPMIIYIDFIIMFIGQIMHVITYFLIIYWNPLLYKIKNINIIYKFYLYYIT